LQEDAEASPQTEEERLPAVDEEADRSLSEEPTEESSRRPSQEPVQRLPAPRPKRPAPSWVIFREAFHEKEDVTCAADWTGGSRLEIRTDNIKRLTLDLTRLPPGAPGRGPWNLQIDSQGMEITGFHGKVLDLVRSKNGNWTVDRSKFRR
jgi:hypothetical protein